MKKSFTLACLAGLLVTQGATSTQVPPMPPEKRKSIKAATQGSGALALIAKPKIAIAPLPTTNTFAWKYPSGINPSNYWWDVQASVDFQNWSTVVTNASGASEVTVKKTDPLRVYRLSRKLTP
jgi:hypothetical protein